MRQSVVYKLEFLLSDISVRLYHKQKDLEKICSEGYRNRDKIEYDLIKDKLDELLIKNAAYQYLYDLTIKQENFDITINNYYSLLDLIFKLFKAKKTSELIDALEKKILLLTERIDNNDDTDLVKIKDLFDERELCSIRQLKLDNAYNNDEFFGVKSYINYCNKFLTDLGARL